MSNTTVRAAAEGMPAINRRRLLLGLAAASTAAATVTVATAAAPVENPELIRLADELPAVLARYLAAAKIQNDTLKHWSALWPLAPDEISSPTTQYGWTREERTFEDATLYRKGEERPRHLIVAKSLDRPIARVKRLLKGKALNRGRVFGKTREEWQAELDDMSRIQAAARKYEAETQRMTNEAQYEALWRETAAAIEAFAAHVSAIMDQPDHTMAGLIIKAEALAAWGNVDAWRAPLHGKNWPRQIAAAILRHAQGGEA